VTDGTDGASGFQSARPHAATVSLPALKQELAYLKAGLNALKAELEQRKNDPPQPDDDFVPTMKVRPAPRTQRARLNARLTLPHAPWPCWSGAGGLLLQRFYDQASKQFQEIEDKFNKVEKTFIEAVQMFGEDPKSTTPEDFFSIFFRFVELWVVRVSVQRRQRANWAGRG